MNNPQPHPQQGPIPTGNLFFDSHAKSLFSLMDQPEKRLEPILKIFHQITLMRKDLKNNPNLRTQQQIKAISDSLDMLSTKYDQTINELSYTYNQQTKNIFEQIENQQTPQNKLEQCKRQIIRLMQIVKQKKPRNFEQQQQKNQKLDKLQNLYENANNKLQQKQKHWQKPYFIQQFFEGMQKQSSIQFNFLLIAGWMISLTLTYKDDSQCIDDQWQGYFLKDYRQWLKINGWGTLACSVVATITYLLNQFDFEKKISQPRPRNSVFSCIHMFFALLNILCFAWKFIWIMIGMKLFLNDLKFSNDVPKNSPQMGSSLCPEKEPSDRCSSNLQSLCSIEFIAFFVIFILILVRVFLYVLKKIRKQGYCQGFVTHQSYYSLNSTDESDPRSRNLNQYHENLGRNFLFYGNTDDIDDILAKLSIWVVIGWTYNFFILIKDPSTCLDHMQNSFNFSYREWVKIDGAFTVSIFGLIVILGAISIITETQMRIWRNDDKGFYRIQLGWFCEHILRKTIAIILLIVFVFRVAWIIFGLVLFFGYVKFSDCTDTVQAFTIAYFSQWIFIILQGLAFLIKGEMAKAILRTMRRNPQNQTQTQQMIQQNQNREVVGVQINIRQQQVPSNIHLFDERLLPSQQQILRPPASQRFLAQDQN